MSMRRTAMALLLLLIFHAADGIPVQAQEARTPSGIPISALEGHIDGFMERHIGVTTPGAAVIVVKDGDVVFSKGYGHADLAGDVAVDPEHTVFEYGSVSKLFVYTSIMRLWEQGKVDLEADIRTYLPQGFLKKVKYDSPITLIDVMNHTTGFEDYLFDVVLPSSRAELTMEEALRDRQPAQVYEPGTVSSYSNYAVALAAHIVERQTGRKYSDYLLESVMRPLGMTSTSPTAPDVDLRPDLIGRKAKGYVAPHPGEFIPGWWSYMPLYAAGGMNGTAADLAKFAMAMMPEKGTDTPLFADRSTLVEMFSPSYRIGPGVSGSVHGFIEWEGTPGAFGHGGNTAAFSSQMTIVPQEQFGVVILTNAFGETAITSGLTDALLGKEEGEPVPGKDLPDAGQVQGTYVAARRMHTGFLELIGYLALLEVRALDASRIELRMAGQTATLVQTQPYLYERLEADGSLFQRYFRKLYFEMEDGNVRRLSGDFLPLPPGRTMSFLALSVFMARAGMAYFLGALIALFIGNLYRQASQKGKVGAANRIRKPIAVLVLLGLLLFLNNGLLILRVMFSRYLSLGDVRGHILLNYPLVIASFLLSLVVMTRWKKEEMTMIQKTAYSSVVLILFTTIVFLANWQFFHLF